MNTSGSPFPADWTEVGHEKIQEGRRDQHQRQRLDDVLCRHGYLVAGVVWATMPKDSAWQRAALQSQLLTQELQQALALNPATRERVIPLAQPWFHSRAQRPVFSVVILGGENGQN